MAEELQEDFRCWPQWWFCTRAAISLAQNLQVRVYINIYNGPHEKP